MKLTPDILRGAYEYLRTTPPFNKWGLPDGDEVGFHVSLSNINRGMYWNDGTPHIQISDRLHEHSYSIIATMAHEMCHILDEGKAMHGAEFKRLTNLVCRFHGFDPAAF